MQIKNVEVKNYRSLKKVTVGSLDRINMLYGYNNTGKSNFLRFIELARLSGFDMHFKFFHFVTSGY